MDSILTSIKKMLGIAEDYTHFDVDLTIHINAVLSILTQIGVGAPEGFKITSKTDLWSTWLGTAIDLEAVKTFVYLKVKLLFDPPMNSAVSKSYEELIRELEWRLLVTTDPEIITVVEEDEEDLGF